MKSLNLHPGEQAKGTVISLNDEEVIVNKAVY